MKHTINQILTLASNYEEATSQASLDVIMEKYGQNFNDPTTWIPQLKSSVDYAMKTFNPTDPAGQQTFNSLLGQLNMLKQQALQPAALNQVNTMFQQVYSKIQQAAGQMAPAAINQITPAANQQPNQQPAKPGAAPAQSGAPVAQHKAPQQQHQNKHNQVFAQSKKITDDLRKQYDAGQVSGRNAGQWIKSLNDQIHLLQTVPQSKHIAGQMNAVARWIDTLTKMQSGRGANRKAYVYVSDNLLNKYGQEQPMIELDDPPMIELDPPVAAKPKPKPLTPKAQLANKVKHWLLTNKRPDNRFSAAGPHGERYLSVNEPVGPNGELGPQTTNALKTLQHDIAFRSPTMPDPFVKQDGTLNDPNTVKAVLEHIQ